MTSTVDPRAAPGASQLPKAPASPWHETVLDFDCGGARLFGVLAQPTVRPATPLPAVLIVVGGPQYRAGSHRQFVALARRLAGAGFATLRFDARGMGDSGGERRGFEDQDDDIAAALDALLATQPAGTRAVLWGLCDGASAALLYLDRRADARVAGVALLNPWVRNDATLARTQVKHYYGQRLLQASFWAKLLRGGVGPGALAGLGRSLRLMFRGERGAAREPVLPFQGRMARQWRAFPGSILLMLSGNDYTAREFEVCIAGDPAWRGALARPGLERVDLPRADHTLSERESRREGEAATLRWLQALGAACGQRLP